MTKGQCETKLGGRVKLVQALKTYLDKSQTACRFPFKTRIRVCCQIFLRDMTKKFKLNIVEQAIVADQAFEDNEFAADDYDYEWHDPEEEFIAK